MPKKKLSAPARKAKAQAKMKAAAKKAKTDRDFQTLVVGDRRKKAAAKKMKKAAAKVAAKQPKTKPKTLTAKDARAIQKLRALGGARDSLEVFSGWAA